MPKLKPLVFMPLDLETFAGSERLMDGHNLSTTFDSGLQAYVRAQYDESIAHFKAALQTPRPGSGSLAVLTPRERAVIHLYIGNALSNGKEWQAARREYQHAVDADPDLPEAHYNLGVALAALHLPDHAIIPFKEALDRDEGLYEPHFALGRTYQRLGDPLRAYIHYTSAHEARPEASEPLYYMGLMHQSQGAAELAQESFARALQVETTMVEHDTGPQDLVSHSDAETAQWYYRLADDLKAQGYDDDAARIYRALLDWQPAEHRARYLIGNLLARMKRWEDAVAEYLHIPHYDPYYVVARLRVAAVLRLSKRLKQAYHVLYECAQARPYEGQTFVQMGKILYDLERPAAAARSLERATELMRNDAFAHYMLGFMYLVIGKEAWAITAWRRSIALQPQTYSLRYDLACIYVRRGQYDQAIAELAEVLEHRPDDLGAAFLLGLCYQESSDPARAIPLFERVVKRQPAHVQALYHLGACYLQAGNSALGRAYLKRYDRLLLQGAGAGRLPHEALPKHLEKESALDQVA
jgi:tetratricopeptide (TPR) repeat protein